MLKTKRFEYTPILGWSVSRFSTFSTCRRLYYYEYYGKYDTEFGPARIQPLKNLTSIPLEIGNIVHDVIAALLKRLLVSNRDIDRAKFEDFMTRMATQQARNKHFFEVHYVQQEAVEPEDLLPAALDCMAAFLDSPRFAWIRDKALANPTEWLIEPPGYGEARLQGMKVYCKVNFLFVVDGRVTILDWKTGRADTEKHLRQLLGYGAWAVHHLGVPAAAIDAVTAYLKPVYSEIARTPTDAELTDSATQIRAETDQMQALCRDIPQNLPREKNAFPLTDNERACHLCNYRELCNRMA